MHPIRSSLLLLAFSGLPVVASAAQIEWQSTYAVALERAQQEQKVLFLAVNMDGESANDLAAKKLYKDKTLAGLSTQTINLIASQSNHSGAKTCSRFGGLTCEEHQQVDIQARKNIIKEGFDGRVIAPQHVFLNSQAEVILSVPFQISQAELHWCFVTALRKADPTYKGKLPSQARAPKRLIMGDVFDPGSAGVETRPLNEQELEETIKKLRAGLKGPERVAALFRIVTTDDPEAVDFTSKELKGKGVARNVEMKLTAIDTIGRLSPASYWECLTIFTSDPDHQVRSSAAVAFEQLAAPQSVKTIRKSLSKEKEIKVRKNWVRALGTAGAEDKASRSLLLKLAKSDKEPLIQKNAMLALASHMQDDKAQEFILGQLTAEDSNLRRAAACAIGMSRRESLQEILKKHLETETNEEVKEALRLSLQVLQGANLSVLAATVRSVGQDELPREKFFGPTAS